MDGLQGKVTNSLQFRLSAALSTIIIVLALGAGAFSFWTAFEEANELQDDQLRQIAALIDQHEVPVGQRPAASAERGVDPDLQVIVQTLGLPTGPAPADAGAVLTLPPTLPDGLQNFSTGRESWRLYVKAQPTGVRLVVGQQSAARDETARTSALRTVLPLLALVPLLLVLVAFVVRRGLQPVRALSRALDHRAEHDLAALHGDEVPTEIRPFIASINRLLARVARSMQAQRRFVADAAHELRSPLTALSLQAEALEGKDLPKQARDQIASLRQGMQRTRSLLDQMLTLARFEANPATVRPLAISLLAVVRSVIEEQMPLAESRQIDLGVVSGAKDALVCVRDVELHAVLRNLVDNAVRYTPPGGRVDVCLRRDSGCVTLEVIDSGPGIPEAERERVFDAFYRVLGTDTDGSGLGLAIVKALADRIGARVSLHSAEADGAAGGLRVMVSFPLSAGTGPSSTAT